MSKEQSILGRLASSQNRRDEIPNQELARELAAKKNRTGIRELVENLDNPNKKIRNDCIKTLYETGYIAPELIQDYTEDFLNLLRNPDNRLVWGGMIALSTIADKAAKIIFNNFDFLCNIIKKGSVITVDSGIKTLGLAASVDQKYNKKIFPYLITHLKTCRPKEVAQHAESIFPAVNKDNIEEFLQTLKNRESHLSNSQISRLKRIYKKLQ